MATPDVPPDIQPSSLQVPRSHSEPPPSHQPDPLDPMNFEYPDLGGSVHAVFDTQLPGAAIDPTQSSQDSQEEPGRTGSGGLPPTSRRTEKAPAQNPPSFGLFGTSQDRTQDLFFPPTVGSLNPNRLPEPTSPLPYLVQACAKLLGHFGNIEHRFQDIESALAKCNSRVDSAYHLLQTYHEEQMTVSNDCLRALKDILTEVRRPAPTARPATPLPPRPRAAAASGSHPVAPTASVPLVVITAPTRDHPVVVAPAPPASGPAPSTCTRFLRKSAEGPKN